MSWGRWTAPRPARWARKLAWSVAAAVAMLTTASAQGAELPKVLVRVLYEGFDATSWSVHDRFSLEVRGAAHNLEGGTVYLAEYGVCDSPLGAGILEDPLTASAEPAVSEEDGAVVWQWTEIRILRGGVYSACWCSAGCVPQLNFTVQGPQGLVPSPPPPAGASYSEEELAALAWNFGYAMEAFDVAIAVHSSALASAARIRVVDGATRCGAPSSAMHTHALLADAAFFDVPSGGMVASPPGLPPHIVWRGLAFNRAGHYRVCFCTGGRVTDAGLFNVSLDLDLSFETFEGVNVSNKTIYTNYTNITTGTTTSSPSSTTTSSTSTTTVAPVVPVEEFFDCAAGSDFDVDVGTFSVAGPTAFTLLVDGEVRPTVIAKEVFNLTIPGIFLGEGQQRLRINRAPSCGGPGASNITGYLSGPLADDPDLPGEGADLNAAQTWFDMAMDIAGGYTLCWCSALAGPCESDEAFNVFVGTLIALWPPFQVLDETGVPLRALANVGFTLILEGAEVSTADRIRLVDFAVQCGDEASVEHSPSLRGPLRHHPDLPGEPIAGRPFARQWRGLRLIDGGIRRVCWCSGENFPCNEAAHFAHQAGSFAALQVLHVWPDACARARSPFRIHVAALGLAPEADRVLVARATDVCGEARPRGLVPGGVLANASGYAALECVEDPNAGAIFGERKMVCGNRVSSVMLPEPGVYKVCLCARLPLYDCSEASHYWLPAGDTFEVSAATSAGQAPEDVEGGDAPVPMTLNGPSPVVSAAYAPVPWAEEPGLPVDALSAGRILATGCEDGAVRLWQVGLEHPHLVAELVGHAARAEGLVWAPNGEWLASSDTDGAIRVWAADAGIRRRGGPPHVCPRWAGVWERPGEESSDQEWQDVILGHLIGVLPLNMSEELPRAYLQDRPLPNDLADLASLTLRRAATQCAKACAAYMEMADAYCDCGRTRECHLTHDCLPKCGLEAYVWPRAHNLRITALSASPDGRWLASASVDRTIRLWDMANFSQRPAAVLESHRDGPVLTLAFAPTNVPRPSGDPSDLLLVSGGGDFAMVWHELDVSTEAPVVRLVNATRYQNPLGDVVEVQRVAFSPNGRWFAFGGSALAQLWNASTRRKVRDLEQSVPKPGVDVGQDAPLAEIAFAGDSSWMALRGPSEILMWPLNSTADVPKDVWVNFSMQDIGDALMTWTLRPGVPGNKPVYELRRAYNGTLTEILITPCNISSARGCADSLPIVQLDIEAPFDFTAVAGSFVEYSSGPNGADDCRGGTNHSEWNIPNATQRYFTRFASDYVAIGSDCIRLGPPGIFGRDNASACLAECALDTECNVFNYRTEPPSCDLRRCLDATRPRLTAMPGDEVWSLILRSEAEERLVPPQDGYVMFGAPSRAGVGGVVYGGCGAGPDLSGDGVTVRFNATVPATRRLRWEVAQSRSTETLGLRTVSLQLRRVVQGRRYLTGVAPARALAFAPSQLELVAAVGATGDVALWDLRGFEFPKGRKVQFKLKSIFGFGLTAAGLQSTDRVSVVDATAVALCGDPHSAETSRALQGLAGGQRTNGNATFSSWNRLAVNAPGSYRVCFCAGRPHTCCDADQDYATEVMTFVAAGAASGHYVVCEPTIRGAIKSCKIENFRGVGLQAGDMIMIQDTLTCGLGAASIPGIPGVMTSRASTFRDWQRDLSGIWPGGEYYRFEKAVTPVGNYDPIAVTVNPGLTARLCWCGKMDGCDPSNPRGFRVDAGTITIMRLEEEVRFQCKLKGDCVVPVKLATAKPMGAGDQLMAKNGTANPEGKQGRLSCEGAIVPGLGAFNDGVSGRMKVDGEFGMYEFGQTEALVGTYILCWCQASIRPCLTDSDFNFYIGTVQVVAPKYVFPSCVANEVMFVSWRDWETWDDCCCNYAEAGAVGCFDEYSVAFAKCSLLPSR